MKNILGAYLDNELKDKTKKKVEKHLKVCSECMRELNSLKKLDEIAKETIPPQQEESYWEAFPNRVRAGITQQIKKSKQKQVKEFFTRPLIIKPSYLKWVGTLVCFVIIFLAGIYYLEHYRPLKKMPELAKKIEKPQEEISVQSIESEEIKEEGVSIPSVTKKKAISKPKPPAKREKREIAEKFPRKRTDIKEDKTLVVEKEVVGGVVGGVVSKVEPPAESLDEEDFSYEQQYETGQALQKASKLNEAIANYNMIINRNPKGKWAAAAQFQINIIQTFSQDKISDEKILRKNAQIWQKYIEDYPESEFIPQAYKNLADIAYNLAKISNKEEDINEAIKATEAYLKFTKEKKEIDHFNHQLRELKKKK
ncbi:MAG: zf-HC2 domain-containing protein [Candidatus Aminicenantia bacterium]